MSMIPALFSVKSSVLGIGIEVVALTVLNRQIFKVLKVASLRQEITRISHACYFGLGLCFIAAIAKIWVPGGYFLPLVSSGILGLSVAMFETVSRPLPSIWHHSRFRWGLRCTVVLLPMLLSGILPENHVLALAFAGYFGLRFISTIAQLTASRLNMLSDLEQRIVADEAVKHNDRVASVQRPQRKA